MPNYDLEELKKKKILIVTPFYMSQGFSPYFSSVLSAGKALSAIGVEWDFWGINGDSYVERAKNSFLMLFKDSAYTDMVMIDSDLQFDVEGFLRVALSDRDFIAAAYPMKNGWDKFAGLPVTDANGNYTEDENGDGIGIAAGDEPVVHVAIILMESCMP